MQFVEYVLISVLCFDLIAVQAYPGGLVPMHVGDAVVYSSGAIEVHTEIPEELMRRQDNLADELGGDDNDDDDSGDDVGFADAVSSYSRNRWNNFKTGFVELGDIFRAAGRGIRSLFTGNENDE